MFIIRQTVLYVRYGARQADGTVRAVWSTSCNLLHYLHKCMYNIPRKAAVYSIAFLMMNMRCSKHVEDKN
jgi:hypothetical protein